MNVEGFGSGETKTERLIRIKNLHCLKLQFDICKSLIPFILLDCSLLSTIVYMKVQCNIWTDKTDSVNVWVPLCCHDDSCTIVVRLKHT